MPKRPHLRIFSITDDVVRDDPPAAPSKALQFAKLTALLIASLALWAVTIWYSVMMWKAR